MKLSTLFNLFMFVAFCFGLFLVITSIVGAADTFAANGLINAIAHAMSLGQ